MRSIRHSAIKKRPGLVACSSGKAVAAILLALAMTTCAQPGSDPQPEPTNIETAYPRAGADLPWFSEKAAESGLDFVHFNGMSGWLLLTEITCGGGGLVDVDGDGDLDAYLLQGTMLGSGREIGDAQRPPAHPQPLTDRLYRNDLESLPDGTKRFRFVDVTEGLGAVTTSYGCSLAAGDVDNDGRVDLYLANLGADQMLRNEGGGRFSDITSASGLGLETSSVTATFFDYDRDGWLDLFVGSNMDFDNSGPSACRSLDGSIDYCGPGAYPNQPDQLYHNLGDGRFENVTDAAGISSAPLQPTLGSVAADFDGDGWIDLYVANDRNPNNLWLNQKDGTFSDEGLFAGCALNGQGMAEASMGIDAGDFDDDGDLDVILTHLVKQTNTLYRNDGAGFFVDDTLTVGLGAPSLPYTSFGIHWLDVDLDGWLDLFIANGAVVKIPTQAGRGDPFPLHQPDQLFHNLAGDGGGVRFADVSAIAGPAFSISAVSRGAAIGDVDNDGDPDVLVFDNGAQPRLLINQVGDDRTWLGVTLSWGSPGRDALGSMAALLRGGKAGLWRRVSSDGSFNSASDPRIVFGMLGGSELEGVRVKWPDGSVEDFSQVEVGRYTTLRHGEGRIALSSKAET